MDRCDEDVFTNGTAGAYVNGPRSHTIEDWVQDVAARSGQKTDWSMAAGWAIIKTTGDVQKVRGVMEELWETLVAAYLVCDDNFTANPERQDGLVRWQVARGEPIEGNNTIPVARVVRAEVPRG